ncbi:proteasome regulatory particle base subunit [Tulasnella sp. 427]|nr:proteasome regulatory particle base subunit [Tulasnella sp. 427]
MARFGAAVAQGLIDSEGRNVQPLVPRREQVHGPVIVTALFYQFCSAYPLVHCASLSLEPLALLTPAFDFILNAKPSLYAYPAATKLHTKEANRKVETDVLSTTVKASAWRRAKGKAKAAGAGEATETDEKKTEAKPKDDDTSMKVDVAEAKPAEGGPAAAGKLEPKKQRGASSEKLSNLSRVTPARLSYMAFLPEGRFQPVKAGSRIGVIDRKGLKEGSYTAWVEL